jgi:hypothetical protein
MEELPSTALKWPFPKTLNSRLWRLSSAIIIGGTAAFSKIWLGKFKMKFNICLLCEKSKAEKMQSMKCKVHVAQWLWMLASLF